MKTIRMEIGKFVIWLGMQLCSLGAWIMGGTMIINNGGDDEL